MKDIVLNDIKYEMLQDGEYVTALGVERLNNVYEVTSYSKITIERGRIYKVVPQLCYKD